MKSFGQLWAQIVAPENLRAAWGRVRRGHAGSPEVLEFEADLDSNLESLGADLLAGTYRPGAYRQFGVLDPKPRTISCALVRDRVVHHALCGVIAPLLERSFSEDSYACREGKGTHRACARARDLVRRHPYYCKLDVRRYFDGIEHDRLLSVLLPLFREREVRTLIEAIVRHPVPGQARGRGLPIGNLTSQWFANAYLSGFDHFAKQRLRLPAYIRYMDDMVLFASSKAACWHAHDEAKQWLRERRGLEVKDEATIVAPVGEGLPFLGLRIFRSSWRLQRQRFLRTRRKHARHERAWKMGLMDEARLQACAVAADGGVRWFGIKGILADRTGWNRSLQNPGMEGRLPRRPDGLKIYDWVSGEGAASGSNRVKRGGSWNNNARNCRSANRNNNNPDNRNNNNGFRPASTMRGQDTQGPIRNGPRPANAGTNMPIPGRLVAPANASPGIFLEQPPRSAPWATEQPPDPCPGVANWNGFVAGRDGAPANNQKRGLA